MRSKPGSRRSAPRRRARRSPGCCRSSRRSSTCAGAASRRGSRSASSTSAWGSRTTRATRRPGRSCSTPAASARPRSCCPTAAACSRASSASSPATTSSPSSRAPRTCARSARGRCGRVRRTSCSTGRDMTATIVRAQILHTPRDPFTVGPDALEALSDGGLAYDENGRILATGSFADVRAAHPAADVHDASDAILLPGLVDLHVHYPQIAVIGSMGMTLLEWLATRTLPEEARLADTAYAEEVARVFVRGLARNGTTTALVFGSHFPAAQEALFAEAERSGLRIASGLVVSDQNLMPVLHSAPEEAYERSRALIERWHGRGRLRYAVTPRFSLSCTDAMLECCGAVLADGPADLLFTSHINENPAEIQAVAELFPWAHDYLHTYERHGLVGRGSVLAHDVHVSDSELRRLAAADASVAHCPSSNAFLASGIFPMARHCEHGVRFGLGTDVGAGTGLSLFKEALMAYHVQMVREGC